GMLNANGYETMGLFAAIFCAIVLYASAWFTRDRIPHLTQPDEDQAARFSWTNFGRDLMMAISNRNYLFLLLGFFLLSVTLGAREGFNNYMNLFYWELVPDQMRFYVVGTAAGYILAFTQTFRIHRMIDKRATIVLSALGLAILPAIPVILRIWGMFPENGADNLLFWLIVFNGTGAAAGAILNISVMSALADIADENELKFGNRQEGVLYAARTFFAKADHALGIFVAGLAIDLIQFPVNAKPGEVEADTIHMLGLIDSPYSIIPAAIAAAFYAGYRINRHKHAKIREELAARSAA
ncbi:MAG: MFS transporter, partial [Pseudomonadota bacterium]